MKKNKKMPILIGIVAFVIIAVIVVIVLVNSGHRVIKVKSYEGTVLLERSSEMKEIIKDMNLKSEDTITTGADGLIELLADEDKHILAVENTGFSIVKTGSEEKGTLKIKLNYGTSLIEIENKLPEGASFEVTTPNVALSVRGTIFEVTYIPETNTTILRVVEGIVQVDTNIETGMVNAGETVIIKDTHIEYSDEQAGYGDIGSNANAVPVGNAGIPGTPVDREGLPDILKGGSDFNQLIYLLEVASRCEYEWEDDYLKNALYWMYNKTYSEPPYELIEDLGEEGVVYDVNQLNELFSFLTDDTISEENLNPGMNRLDGERLICTPVPVSINRTTSVGITYMYYGDQGEIIVEYIFDVMHTDTMETESFIKKAYLIQDETGKYILDYIE